MERGIWKRSWSDPWSVSANLSCQCLNETEREDASEWLSKPDEVHAFHTLHRERQQDTEKSRSAILDKEPIHRASKWSIYDAWQRGPNRPFVCICHLLLLGYAAVVAEMSMRNLFLDFPAPVICKSNDFVKRWQVSPLFTNCDQPSILLSAVHHSPPAHEIMLVVKPKCLTVLTPTKFKKNHGEIGAGHHRLHAYNLSLDMRGKPDDEGLM